MLTGLCAAVLMALLLTLARPDVAALRDLAHHPGDALAARGPDRILASVCSAGAWLAFLVLGLMFLTAIATALPGAAGNMARRACSRVVPATLLRVAVATVGMSVATAGVASAAAVPADAPSTVTSGQAGSAEVDVDWPQIGADDRDPVPTPRPTPDSVPSREPDQAPDQASDQAPGTPTGTVTVRPGDSLWRIAERRLGPDAADGLIDAEWRRWYASNRGAVGPDPNLIRPGTVLLTPGSPDEEHASDGGPR